MSRLTRLLNLFRSSSLEREFDEELRFHLEGRIEENLSRGMSPEKAEADACRRFGAVESAKKGMRHARAVPLGPAVFVSAVAAVTLVVVLSARLSQGTSGTVYELSDTVSAPVPIETSRPEYTGAALRARVQGAVRVRCVVQPAGVCSDIEIVDSLDREHGLDDEAVRAARQWRFRPALLDGNAVATRIVLEFKFALR